MNQEAKRGGLLAELKILNEKVEAVLLERKMWMDSHMVDFAKVQIGEPIYDLSNGKLLGVVSKHYRYWDSQHNPLYDTGMDIACEYHTGNNIFDNTSRQTGLIFGGEKDLQRRYLTRGA